MTPFFTQAPPRVAVETLLLLDRNDRIIGIRPAPNVTELPCAVGDGFFDRFPIGKRDRAALFSCRRALDGNTLLLHTGDRPMLILGYLYAATGLTIIALPEGKERRLLDAPASYSDKLQYITFAPSASARRKPATEEGYLRLSALMNALCRPFLFSEEIKLSFGKALTQLALHITWLAQLFDCTTVCRFQSLIYSRPDNYCPDLALGAMTATLLAARRLTGGCELTVNGLWQDPVGPVLSISIPATADALPDITAYMQEAHDRGRYFEVVRKDGSTELRFALCISELSAQNLKAHGLPKRHTVISFEMVSDPPKSVSTPKEAIPLFHDGKWAPGSADKKEKT